MDCMSVLRELWDYLDGELTDERMDAIRGHLAECRDCHPYFDFERQFLEAVAATRDEHPVPAMVRRKVMAKLRYAGFAVSGL
jgi:anti-sigma factor (TIGR02949 family)